MKDQIAKIARFVGACVLSISMPWLSVAQGYPSQGNYSSVLLDGRSFSCVARGRVIPIVINYNYHTIAEARHGDGVMVINPAKIGNYQTYKFIVAHECAHFMLGTGGVLTGATETDADCLGIRLLRDNGMVRNRQQLLLMISEIQGFASSSSHLPGPQRSRVIQNCFYN